MATANSTAKRWTEEEDAYVRAQYGHIPAAEIALHLGRTVGAVWGRVHTLGIAKPSRPSYLTCPVCGRVVRVHGTHRKYCSLQCAYASKERVSGRQNRPKDRGTRLCSQCGKSWVVTTRKAQRKYCSKKCSVDASRKREERTCKWCGAVFVVVVKSGRVCCSWECGNAVRVAGMRKWRAVPENDEQVRAASSKWHREKGPATPMYSNRKDGRREDLDDRYFRSAWEANIARYLNWLQDQGQIAKWEYEPDTFWFDKIRRGTRSYRPDFKIWDTEEGEPYYWEVKGYDYARGQTARKRMAKYYPNVRVIVIDEAAYKEIRKWKGLFPGWEGR